MVQPSTNNIPVVPDLAEFLARRMRDISARINCLTIGEIVTFDATKQTAVIKVSFLKTLQGVNPLGDTGLGSDEVISIPPQLVDVPIIFLQGGGSFLTFPIAAGDACLLLFCDRDMDSWFNAGLVAAPNSNRVHDINDAVALVGIRNLTKSLTSYNTTDLVLGNTTSYIKIPPNASGLISIADRTGERLTQSGFLQPYAGSAAPSGWLLCYGQSVLRATYPDLFAIIGTTYGSADGTHFNIPDLRGRNAVGLDNMGGVNANVLTNTYNPNRNTLGGSVGEEAHTLVIAELATHSHVVGFNSTGSSGLGTFEEGAGPPNMSLPAGNGTTYQGTSADTGSSTPHQNVQPGMMINWLIKI